MIVLRLYQVVLSPLMGARCRFFPSCSEYTRQAIEKFGLLHGVRLGAARLMKCHPFHPGGVDPVP